jgi:hypothetical protein
VFSDYYCISVIHFSIVQNAEQNEGKQTDSDLNESQYDDHNLDLDDPLGMNIEDFLPNTPDSIDEDEPPEIFSRWLYLNGKKILKTSLVATLSTIYSKKLTVRTFRTMGLTLETLLNSKRHNDLLGVDNDVDLMKKKDLAACLVKTGPKICLAVIEVIGFLFGGGRVAKSTATMDDLEDPDKQIKVVGQIINLGMSSSSMESWDWNKQYVALDIDSQDQRLTHCQ